MSGRWISTIAGLVASTTAAAADVESKTIFSDFFACNNGPLHHQNWVNTTGKDLVIVKALIWNGLDYNRISDVPEAVRRHSDGTFVVFGGHDDYDQGSQRHMAEDWGGNPLTLAAGVIANDSVSSMPTRSASRSSNSFPFSLWSGQAG